MKKVLIINGNPDEESLSNSFALKYEQGAKAAGTACDTIHLRKLSFNPVLQFGYRQRTELEPDLLNAQEAIKKADHLVFVFPTWWGVYPALLKGFFDRVFLPGFSFKYRENSILWDKLLKGKTARLIVTMDSPVWYNRFMYKNAGINAVKKATLKFCGVKPVRVTSFGNVRKASKNKIENWLHKIEGLGKKVA